MQIDIVFQHQCNLTFIVCMKNNILFHNVVQIQVKNGMVGLGFAYWEWIG